MSAMFRGRNLAKKKAWKFGSCCPKVLVKEDWKFAFDFTNILWRCGKWTDHVSGILNSTKCLPSCEGKTRYFSLFGRKRRICIILCTSVYAGTQLEDGASLPSMVLRAYFIFFLPLILPSHSAEEEEEGETEGYMYMRYFCIFGGFLLGMPSCNQEQVFAKL